MANMTAGYSGPGPGFPMQRPSTPNMNMNNPMNGMNNMMNNMINNMGGNMMNSVPMNNMQSMGPGMGKCMNMQVSHPTCSVTVKVHSEIIHISYVKVTFP